MIAGTKNLIIGKMIIFPIKYDHFYLVLFHFICVLL